LEAIWQKYRDEGVSVVAVESYYDTEGAKEFIAENNLTYHLLENGKGEHDVVRNYFGIALYSTSYVINGEGKVIFVHQGWDDDSEKKLEGEIQELLAR
jgi:peroxiredoxin